MRKCLLSIIIICLFLPQITCSAELFAGQEIISPLDALDGNVQDKVSYNEIEISNFEIKEDAERFAQIIRNGGFETIIRSDITEDKKTVYKVFVRIYEEQSFVRIYEEQSKDALPLSSKEIGSAPKSKALSFEDKPVGTVKTSWDIFGRKGGYFHPSLSVTGIYTDNASYSKNNKKSDFSTILTPEIWISVPRVNQKLSDIDDTSSRSPGGLILSRFKPEISRRYQTHLLYLADIPLSSKNSPSGDTVSHKFIGSFTYKGPSLALDLIDQFLRSYEARETGISTVPDKVDKYKSNLFHTILSYDSANKFRLRFDYANFILDYDASRDTFRNRIDNSFSGYLFYKFKPKTSVFVEYTFMDIAYDEDSTLDSKEHHFWGGIQWNITAKSRGRIKAGYGIKDAAHSAGNNNNFIFEAQINHKFTPKTSLTLTAFRKTNETNILTTFFMITNRIGVEYQQLLTARITGSVNLSYTKDRYKGDLTFGSKTKEREDNIYQVAFGLQYEFRKWLKSVIGYTFTRRDSNFSDFNYSSNTIFFRTTGSL